MDRLPRHARQLLHDVAPGELAAVGLRRFRLRACSLKHHHPVRLFEGEALN